MSSSTTVHFVDTDDALVVRTDYATAKGRLDRVRRLRAAGETTLVSLLIGSEHGQREIAIPVERIAYVEQRL